MSEVTLRDHNSFVSCLGNCKEEIAFPDRQTTGRASFESGEYDKSSLIWIKLKMGYSQEMSVRYCPPIPSLQLGREV